MVDTNILFRIAEAAEEKGEFDLARSYFERGAALGGTECITRLAYMYDIGMGVDISKETAMRLYKKAWRRGNSVTAANNIAVLYRERGNRRAMFEWYERAARIGDGSACFEMAKCYFAGAGVRTDVQAGLRCLAVAIQSDYISEAEREEAEVLMSSLAPRPI